MFTSLATAEWAFDTVLKATVLLSLAFLVTARLKRRGATLRHTVWSLALVSVLLVPVLSRCAPGWHVALTETAAPVAWNPDELTDDEMLTLLAAYDSAPAPDRFELAALPWLTIWAVGAALGCAWLGLGFWRASAMARRASSDPVWTPLLASQTKRFGIRRPVKLLVSDAIATPVTWGWLRPIVLMPALAEDWTRERRALVLAHELMHVKRLDWPVQVCAHVARTLYWFHPLAWVAFKRLSVEREQACDEDVIRSGATPSVYASHLLDIALGTPARGSLPSATLAMAHRSQLEGRLMSILNQPNAKQRGSLLVPVALLMGGASLCATLVKTWSRPEAAEPATLVTAAHVAEAQDKDVLHAFRTRHDEHDQQSSELDREREQLERQHAELVERLRQLERRLDPLYERMREQHEGQLGREAEERAKREHLRQIEQQARDDQRAQRERRSEVERHQRTQEKLQREIERDERTRRHVERERHRELSRQHGAHVEALAEAEVHEAHRQRLHERLAEIERERVVLPHKLEVLRHELNQADSDGVHSERRVDLERLHDELARKVERIEIERQHTLEKLHEEIRPRSTLGREHEAHAEHEEHAEHAEHEEHEEHEEHAEHAEHEVHAEHEREAIEHARKELEHEIRRFHHDRDDDVEGRRELERKIRRLHEDRERAADELHQRLKGRRSAERKPTNGQLHDASELHRHIEHLQRENEELHRKLETLHHERMKERERQDRHDAKADQRDAQFVQARRAPRRSLGR